MRKIIFTLLAIGVILFVGCSAPSTNQSSNQDKGDELIAIDSLVVESSIRALEFDENSNNYWWAGSGGKFGCVQCDLDDKSQLAGTCKILNEGKIAHINDQGDSLMLEFRSLAFTSDRLFVMSVASPALIYSSADKGANWELVYKNDHPDVFFDSMKFWDDQNGIAVGDPIDGCPAILITRDGGENWNLVDCSSVPESQNGEAFFAASNTNIAISGNSAWIASGGSRARVFRTKDRGESWEVFDTPIAQGKVMTGTFSIDFYDDQIGIIVGGDWEQKSTSTETCAITNDGGETWKAVNDQLEFASCVQFVPGTKGQEILACGSNGMFLSKDQGETWEKLRDSGQYTFRFNNETRDGKYYFLGSGKNILQPFKLSVLR